MAEFVPNLVLDGYSFLMEVELSGWSKFGRGFRARDEDGNYYILELITKKRRGMDLLLGVTHRNLLNCFDVRQTEDNRWIQISEYFSGNTLRDLMNSSDEFSYLDIAIICFQICNGLTAIHNLKLIHEDLRPENILINPQGEVKLKGVLIPEVLINYVNIPEIWNYIAPEQITKSVWISPGPKSNVYSIGSMIYEIVTRKKYGKEPEELEKIIKDSKDPLISLRSQIESFTISEISEEVPEELSKIILSSLLADPDKRIDMPELSNILASYINSSLGKDAVETVPVEGKKDTEGDISEEGHDNVNEKISISPEEKIEVKKDISSGAEEISSPELLKTKSPLEPEPPSPEEEESKKKIDTSVNELSSQEVKEHHIDMEEQKPSNMRGNDNNQNVTDMKEFIPGVSAGFVSRDPYERSEDISSEDNKKNYDVEHSYKHDILEKIQNLELSFALLDTKNIFTQLDYIREEIVSLDTKTSQFIEKFSNDKGGKDTDFKDTVILNEVRRINKSLVSLFTAFDDFIIKYFESEQEKRLSLKTIPDIYGQKDKVRSQSLSEEYILNLMNINTFVEKATESIRRFLDEIKPSSGKTMHIGMAEETFLDSLCEFLKGEYINIASRFKEKKDLDELFDKNKDFIRMLESVRFFLPVNDSNLKQSINGYVERLTFVYYIYSFYIKLKSRAEEDIKNFLLQNTGFMASHIFSKIIFKNILFSEGFLTEDYNYYTGFPLDVQNYLVNCLKQNYNFNVIDVKEDYYDFDKHNVIGSSITEEKEKKYTISEIIDCGYMYKNEILKKADVKIYV